MRWGWVYMLKPPGLTKPATVRPSSSARSTASDEAADTPASRLSPATAAFCTSSKETRPDTAIVISSKGQECIDNTPTSLSMALWRPMSSRIATNSPSPAKAAAAWSPPLSLKPDCAPAITSM